MYVVIYTYYILSISSQDFFISIILLLTIFLLMNNFDDEMKLDFHLL